MLPCLLLVSCFSRDNEHRAVGGTLGPPEGDGEGPEHAGPARGIYLLYMSTIKCFTLKSDGHNKQLCDKSPSPLIVSESIVTFIEIII